MTNACMLPCVSGIYSSIQQLILENHNSIEWLIHNSNKVKYMYIIEFNTLIFHNFSPSAYNIFRDILLKQMGESHMSHTTLN